MTLGIYDSDNAGTKEDLREAADSFINGFEELDYECFVRGWKRESVAIRWGVQAEEPAQAELT